MSSPQASPPIARGAQSLAPHPPPPPAPALPAEPGESSGQAHHPPGTYVMDIRGPTKSDPPDVWEPKGACAVRVCIGWGSFCGRTTRMVRRLALVRQPASHAAAIPPYLAAEFSSCTVPLVFWPPAFSIFADMYLGATSALSAMFGAGAFDRCGRGPGRGSEG